MRPHRWQPTRLSRPWNSPGKNTGVGCHFFLQCMKLKSESEVPQSCLTPSDPLDCSLPGSSIHGIDFSGKSTGVGCHFLLRTMRHRISEKRREAKGKGEKERRFTHLNVEFQRIARGLIPGSGRSPGEENGNPLQYSCLENSIDRGAWLAGYSP